MFKLELSEIIQILTKNFVQLSSEKIVFMKKKLQKFFRIF